jgi:hypothetical protein
LYVKPGKKEENQCGPAGISSLTNQIGRLDLPSTTQILGDPE